MTVSILVVFAGGVINGVGYPGPVGDGMLLVEVPVSVSSPTAITSAEWKEIWQWLSARVVENGQLREKTTEELSASSATMLAAVKQQACDSVDIEAGYARRRVASAGDLIDEEYRLAYNDALQWDSDGRPAENIPSTIADWSSISGLSATAAADSILQAANSMNSALAQIRSIRLGGKVAIAAAVDEEEVALQQAAAVASLLAFPSV